MSKPFQPNEGDTVEFYNSEAELWEPATVLAHSANRRMYKVQPDHEEQPFYVVDHTNIRPMSQDEDADDTPSFWEAAKTYARATRSLSAIVDRQEREIHSLQVRQSSIADERDMWMSQSIANSVNIGKLQAQIDAFPLSPGSLIGDKVAARIAEHRERAEKAEADLARQVDATSAHFSRVRELDKRLTDMELDRDYWKNRAELTHLQHVAANKRADDAEADRDGWVQEANDNQYISRIGYDERDKALARAEKAEGLLSEARVGWKTSDEAANAAEARVEELEDQNRRLKSVLDANNEDVRSTRLREVKQAAELAELKSALRTLGGAS